MTFDTSCIYQEESYNIICIDLNINIQESEPSSCLRNLTPAIFFHRQSRHVRGSWCSIRQSPLICVIINIVEVGWFVGCLTSQQHASVSQGRICSDNFTCCHTKIEVADPTFHLTQSQYIDTGPTSPSADPITPGAWQGSHWSAIFLVTGMTRPRRNPGASGIRTRDLPLSRPTRR